MQWAGWNNWANFPHGTREAAATNVQWARAHYGWENSAVVPFDPDKMELYPEAGVLHASNKFCARLGDWDGMFEDVCKINVSDYLVREPWVPGSTNCSNTAQRMQDELFCAEHGLDFQGNGTGGHEGDAR